MSKGDMADGLAEDLGKIRDTLAAVLPDDNGKIASDLTRLPARTLRGLVDVFHVLRQQDEKLFEAYLEWTRDDVGDGLMDAIQGRPGFLEWSTRTPEEAKASQLPLNEWLDEVHRIKQAHKDPAYYWSKRLGNPKFDNAIDVLCYEKGMSPQEALDWWRRQ